VQKLGFYAVIDLFYLFLEMTMAKCLISSSSVFALGLKSMHICKFCLVLVEVCFAGLIDTFIISGITNHEEYSLVRELSDEDRERTLTMKRDRSIAKDQKKLEEMKKKLHTDDECTCIMFMCIVYAAVFNFQLHHKNCKQC